MELKINKITYTLKNLNAERRAFYLKEVVSQNSIIHNKDCSQEEKNNAVAKQAQSIIDLIWLFLYSDDKKELKDKSNLKMEVCDYVSFLKNLDEKIKAYSDYINSQPDEGGVASSVEEVYSFLSKQYGWTFDYIREMEELDLLKALNHAIKLHKKENVNNVNVGALTSAFGAGNKKAKKIIDDLNNEEKTNEKIELLKNSQPIKRNTPMMSAEELRRAVNGRRS